MTVNPFPTNAAESGGPIDPSTAVTTPAVQAALDLFRSYLAVDTGSRPVDQPGEVLAVTGVPGSGKTFLTGVLRSVAEAAQPPALSVYLQAESTELATMLKPFAEALSGNDGMLCEGVRDLYAHVVADALAGWEPGEPLVADLRAGRLADPVGLVQRLGLMESTYRQELGERLRAVTGNRHVATALGLLVRPGFGAAVEGWLRGEEPAEVLRDRGIGAALRGDVEVLSAMGALVAALGATGRKVLIVLDELDLVFPAGVPVSAAVATGFRRFLAAATGAGAFVVLAGLPSFVQALPNQVRDRIGEIQRTAPFRDGQVADLVAARSPASPFDREALAEVADLTAGIPRAILRLCRRLMRVGAGPGGTIDRETVRAAARQYVEEQDRESVVDEIARALNENSWAYEDDYYPGESQASHVDFWIEAGDDGAACAILVVDNVLDADDLTAERRRIIGLAKDAPLTEFLVVVVGLLASDAQAALTRLTGTEPVVANAGRVVADVSAAVRTILGRLSSSARDPVVRVGDRVDEMNRRQLLTHTYVAEVALAMDTLRETHAKQLDQVLEQMRRMQPAPETASGTPPALPPAVTLPAVAEGMLDDALRVLADVLERVDAVLAEVFGTDAQGARATLRIRLREDDKVAKAVGVVVLLQQLILAFRNALRDWYENFTQAPHRSAIDALDEICATYSNTCQFLPLFQVDELRQLTVRFPADLDDPFGELAAGPGVIRAPELFGNLAARVQAELTGPTAVRRA
ncbi:hypothetical protein [Rugosimonospora africana]|uniref:Uncharacterized protein n=1 Tax=Rugosimonospora africana TaxID=556532 RepID=A0A8J3QUH9_9ACTN|nr:hypothetical protein [Rugosimonospora africana]GIH15081.1 hypothetical protein Raf01_32530 [Rugosimonospora africana]